MRKAHGLIGALVLALVVFGCKPGERSPEEAGLQAPEVEEAISVRTEVEDLKTALAEEGIEGLRSQMEGFLENMAALQESTGKYAETYKQLDQKAQELQQAVEGGNAAAASQKIDEMIQLVKSLPQRQKSG